MGFQSWLNHRLSRLRGTAMEEAVPMKHGTIFRSLVISVLAFGLVTVSIPSLAQGLALVSPSVANQKFGITITPSPLGIQSGASANAAIVVKSVSFTGTVNLTASISPSGPVVTIDPPVVLVTPLIPGTLTLHVATGSAAAGTYTAKVAGTSPLARSSSTSLVVNIVTLTSTTLSCSSPVAVGQTSLCGVVVTDTSPGATIAPSGTVNVASNGAGSFTATSCNLIGSTISATCSVNFNPSAVEALTINGEYLGDATHSASSGSTSIEAIPRTTSTSMTCSPSTVVIGQQSSCTTTVTDTSASQAIPPSGSVGLLSAGPGLLSPTSCALASDYSNAASCYVTFTFSEPGQASINSTYNGDVTHSGSFDTTSIIGTLKIPTTTTIKCSSPVVIGQPTDCIATVNDNSGATATAPTGTVTFTTNSSFPQLSCALAAGAGATPNCSVQFTPSAKGIVTVSGNYGGDMIHTGSSGSGNFASTVRVTTTEITCSSPVIVGQTNSCTITVSDKSPSAATVPTGNVTFTGSGVIGSFSSDICMLVGDTDAASSCSVSFAPTSKGTATITGNYAGDAAHASSSGSGSITVNIPATTPSTSPQHTSPTSSEPSLLSLLSALGGLVGGNMFAAGITIVAVVSLYLDRKKLFSETAENNQ